MQLGSREGSTGRVFHTLYTVTQAANADQTLNLQLIAVFCMMLNIINFSGMVDFRRHLSVSQSGSTEGS